ncbi:hypothetical protein [Salinicoccus sp. HZC-1]|uniref:hypothetical protein n=1 Tax=Salinicoccus sp. HZC-1 TaxID=3385497 RepID=UPI00398AC4C0
MFSLVFTETAKKIWRNRKNRLILILSILGIFTYLLLYLPSAGSITTLDTERLSLEMEAKQGEKESRLADGDISVNSFTGVDTYSMAKDEFEYYYKFHTALQDGDMYRLAQLKSNGLPMFIFEKIHDHLLDVYDGDLQRVAYHRAVLFQEMEGIAEAPGVSAHLLNKKTAVQQMHAFFRTYGPMITLFVTIFIASEILVDDRKHRTLKAGTPIGWQKYIFYQSISMFVIITGGILSLLALFFIANGILFGFGPLGLEVSHYAYADGYRGEASNFSTQSAGGFILMSLLLITLLIYLFIRINAILSLVFRHDVVVMITGFLLVAFNRIYSGEAEETVFGIEGHYFVQNYFEFGKVLSGERNFLAMTDAFTFQSAVMVIVVTIIVAEIILYFTAGWMNRQKFERQVG